MRRRSILLVGLVLSAVLGGADQASASCIAHDTPCREYLRTPIIFQGLVQGVTTVDYGSTAGRLWRVKVERAWKGLEQVSEVDVLTFGTPGKVWIPNEVEFEIGKRYVVWASSYDKGPALRTHECSLTRLLQHAQDQIEFFDSLARPAAGGYVYGRVSRSDGERAAGAPGLTVVLEGEGLRREALNDQEGRFRFAGLREGQYRVHLVLPDTLALSFPQGLAHPHDPRVEGPSRVSVAIDGPRDSASTDFGVRSSISGIAAARGGNPIPGCGGRPAGVTVCRGSRASRPAPVLLCSAR